MSPLRILSLLRPPFLKSCEASSVPQACFLSSLPLSCRETLTWGQPGIPPRGDILDCGASFDVLDWLPKELATWPGHRGVSTQARESFLSLKGWDQGQRGQVHSKAGLLVQKLGEWAMALIHLTALASSWSSRSLQVPAPGPVLGIS